MYNPEYTDPYGQDIYETEEERRRRLAEEAEANMPTKQTITYDNRTGAQKVKIEGSATNLSAMNPATPTVAGPVNPDDTYQRMIQAESGGRQFNAQGGVLTSPKGALGAGQVMPATAMQPGYGVPNIFDLAQQRGVPVPSRDTAGAQQLLGNEQLNREFGQNYFNAMQQRFPGQPEASVAAYNAGPGRVNQNMAANAGQLNMSQMPNETQAYAQKVLNRIPAQAQAQPIINDQGQVIGAETPAQMMAGAATNAPVAPVDPNAQPQMVQTQGPAAPAPAPEQMGPSTQFMSQSSWIDRFKSAQGNIGTLSSMLADPNLPRGAQMEIAASMADQMRFNKQEAEAKERATIAIETGNLRELERQDKKMGGEGSWLRYIMFGLLGSSQSAQLEKEKLFPELTAQTYNFVTDDGKAAYIRIGKDKTPLRGATEDGEALSQRDLIKYAAGAGGVEAKRALRLPDGTMVNELKNGTLVIGNSKQRFTGDTRQLLTEEQYKTVQDRANNAGQEAAKEQRSRTPGDAGAIQRAFDNARSMVLGPVSGYGQIPGTPSVPAQGTAQGTQQGIQQGTQQGTAQGTATPPPAAGQPWFGTPSAEANLTPGPNESDAAFKSRLNIQEKKAEFFNGAEPASSTTPVTRTGVSAHSVKAGEAEQIFRDMSKIIVDNPQIAGTGRVNNWFDFGLRMATGGYSDNAGAQSKDRAVIVKNLDPIGLKEFERFESLAQRAANTVAKEVNPAGAFQESDAVRAAKQTFSNLKDLGPSTIIEGTRGYAEKNLKDKVFGEFVRNRPDIANIDQARTEFNKVFKPYEAQINGINEVRIKSVDKEMVTRFGADWKQTYNQAIAKKNTAEQTAINNYLTAKSIESERRYPLPQIIDGQMRFENKDQQFAAKYGLDQYLAGRR